MEFHQRLARFTGNYLLDSHEKITELRDIFRGHDSLKQLASTHDAANPKTILQQMIDAFLESHQQGQGNLESDYTALSTILIYHQYNQFHNENVESFFFMQTHQLLLSAIHGNQVALVGKEFGFIINKFTSLACDSGVASKYIRLLMKCAELQAPEPYTLTPSHTCVLQACISSGMYTLGAWFARHSQIMAINPSTTGLNPSDFLRYFYYAGINFIGVRDFAAASDSFMQVLTTPAHAISAIAKEALKKARLVSLIETGRALDLPKYTPFPVLRFAKHDVTVYNSIETHFVSGDETALRQALNEGKDLLEKDQNMGLAKQVLAAFTHNRIRKLTNTYMTLSLESIATSIGGLSSVTEAETALVQMISSDDIVASIDQSNGMVRFGKSDAHSQAGGTQKLNDHMIHELEGHLKVTVALCDRLRDLHKHVLTTSNYVAKTTGGASRGNAGSSWQEDEDEMDLR